MHPEKRSKTLYLICSQNQIQCNAIEPMTFVFDFKYKSFWFLKYKVFDSNTKFFENSHVFQIQMYLIQKPKHLKFKTNVFDPITNVFDWKIKLKLKIMDLERNVIYFN
jgi:hypothetical protein